ncbi:hypothetical protein E4T52_17184 [Aureobasidium sp. EXF-3400]|nr:hypothetical protein E4T52_17184 [Aureobasidium sp. EXF-3400]
MAIPQAIVRKATLDDAQAVAKLGSHVFTVTFGYSVDPAELGAYLEDSYSIEAMAKDISDPQKDMIVATDNKDQIIGFALLTRGTTEPCIEHIPKQVELQRIYVHPSAHGGGVGKLLASVVEQMAREQGFESLWLGVWEENLKALKVYEKLGFGKVGNHDFKIGEVIQTDFIMLKSL